jgi:RNA polymerase sigma-70 factor (ECF subfamily)
LIGTARRTIANQHRSQRRRDRLEARLRTLTDANMDNNASAADRSSALSALAAMRERDREALLLLAWDGLSVTEAAQVLVCTPASLRVRVHRARQRLAVALNDFPTRALSTCPSKELR